MTAIVRGFSFVVTPSMVRMSSGSFIFQGLRTSLLVPRAEEAAEEDEFADVVGVVVGDEERFAEKILAVAPAKGFVEVGGGFFDEGDKGLEVAMDRGNGFVPCVG